MFVIKHHHHNHSLFLAIITLLLKVTILNKQENLGIFVFRITSLERKIEEEYFPLYQETLDDKILPYCCFWMTEYQQQKWRNSFWQNSAISVFIHMCSAVLKLLLTYMCMELQVCKCMIKDVGWNSGWCTVIMKLWHQESIYISFSWFVYFICLCKIFNFKQNV